MTGLTQWILGIRTELDGLRVDPVLPAAWPGSAGASRTWRWTAGGSRERSCRWPRQVPPCRSRRSSGERGTARVPARPAPHGVEVAVGDPAPAGVVPGTVGVAGVGETVGVVVVAAGVTDGAGVALDVGSPPASDIPTMRMSATGRKTAFVLRSRVKG